MQYLKEPALLALFFRFDYEIHDAQTHNKSCYEDTTHLKMIF